MNEKYWDEKLDELALLIQNMLIGLNDRPDAIAILRQIATDQREACEIKFNVIRERWEIFSMNELTLVNKLYNAIRNAEIEK